MKEKKKEPLVCIIIVNYNGYDDTRECLQSVQGIEYGNFVTIVVDNGSKDFSLEKLKKEFDKVTYMESLENLGYTGGNNLGIEKANDLGAEYIFVLNNDTIVSKNVLSTLVHYMESNRNKGMISPLVLYYDKPDTISFGGGTVDRNTGLLKFYNKNEPKDLLKEQVIDCSFLEGCALFIRSDVIKRIGGFNEKYFLTSEESEMCVKIKDMGYELSVITDCYVWHKVSQAMKKESALWSYFLYRNKLHFVKGNSKSIKMTDIIIIIRYYSINFLSYLIRKRNVPAALGLLLGVYGFLRNDTGKGRYRDVI